MPHSNISGDNIISLQNARIAQKNFTVLTNVNLNMRAEVTKNIALGFNVSNLFDTLQLTEGNPRAGSFISGDAGARYFLARPNFGRIIRASATVSF